MNSSYDGKTVATETRRHRFIEHMHSPFTLRSVLGVVAIIAIAGFAYALFNEARERRRTTERNQRLLEVTRQTQETRSKTDELLTLAQQRGEESRQTLEFMREVNASIHALNEKIDAHTLAIKRDVGIRENPAMRQPTGREKQKQRRTTIKRCTKETTRVTPFGNDTQLIERVTESVPCHKR